MQPDWTNDMLRESHIGIFRIIQKANQEPANCHHLMLILRGKKQEEPQVMGFIARITIGLPKKLFLLLELSIGTNGRCPQCGKKFTRDERKLYSRMFQKAKTCGFDVWKLKGLFEERNQKSEEQILEKIVPGNQTYAYEVSRLQGGDIITRKDEDALYDEMIKNFKTEMEL